VAQPPGSEFGADFFKYVLGPVGETLTGFAQQALPTPSGLNMGPGSILPSGPISLGVPGLTSPSYGSFGNPTPNGYVPSAGPELATPRYNVLKQPDPLANGNKPPGANPQFPGTTRPTGAAAIPYAGSYAPNVQRFSAEIKQAAQETGVPERVLASIVHIECAACNPSTVNKAGAAGIAQVVGGPVNPLDNLRAAGRLLREKQRIFGIAPDDWSSTAAAYFGAYRPGVGITADRDMNGVNGFTYVDLFKNAYNIYPDVLGAIPAPTSTPGQRATVSGGNFPRAITAKDGSVASGRPTQFDPFLTYDEQLAACGPAVVAGLAGKSIREVANRAAAMQIWSVDTGMSGGASESRLLTDQGVPNTYIPGVNIPQARQLLEEGKPVVFSMGYVSRFQPGHYFLADAYDPNSGKFHVGTSGTDLKIGSDWMTLNEMSKMGPAQAMIAIEK
jgi:hypothetical protein